MTTNRLFLVLLAAAVTAGCGGHGPTAPDGQAPPPIGTVPEPPPVPPTPPPPPAPTISRTRFLAFGDSMTAGATSPALARTMGAGLPESYPFKLQSLLSARYTAQSIVVTNEGLAREVAEDAVHRLPGVLRATVPEVVILLHGVNDLTGTAAVPRTIGFLNTMARDARLSGATVFLCTLPPERPGGFRALDPKLIASYNAGVRDVARGEGTILVDLERDLDLAFIGADGLHPTEAGYERIAQILVGMIRSQFERTLPTN